MYIRTEDNLYEITDKQYDILCGNLTEEEKENFKNITSFGLGSVEEGTYHSILIKDILKYSENLEELCDEFVYVSKQNEDYEKNEKPIIAITRKLTSLIKIANATNSVVLGAIWTEWGLKYVAKINESGDLKLK